MVCVRMFLRMAAPLLMAVALTLAAAPVALADVHFVTHGRSNRIIIFIDGLKADPGKAFRWGEGVGSWPELMSLDITSEAKQLPLSRYDTAILSFPDNAADRASVPQLAIKGLADLKAKGVIADYQSIVFIAHGAGGLVLKSMMVQSATSGSAGLPQKIRAIFLLSVPAQGRPAASFLSVLAAHESLAVNFGSLDVSVFLQGLESLWSEYLSRRGPTKKLEVYCRHEVAPTFGVAVTAGQYTTEGCDENSEDRTADHQSIARPASRDAGVYRWVRTHLADYFARSPSDPGKPLATAEVAAAEIAATASVPPPAASSTAAQREAEAAAATPVKPNEALTPAPPQSAAPAVASPASAGPPGGDAAASSPRIIAPLINSERAAAGERRVTHTAQTLHGGDVTTRNGDWTFTLHGDTCNLPSLQWVVQLHQREIKSDNWTGRIGGNGKFSAETTGACTTELVRGRVGGISGTGWYLHANPCQNLYCRARFHLTWRHPVPAH